MIIDCPSCKKKFKIDDSLIPAKGRNLQCGSCNYSWFYKIEAKPSKQIILTENVTDNNHKTFDGNNDKEIKLQEPKINKEVIEEVDKNLGKTDEVTNIDSSQKSKNITFSKLLSYLIVSIISFIALVILLDTLKTPLIDIFPGLEKLLFNLFETLKDIKLFIIDLS